MQRHGDGNKKIWITEIGCPGLSRGLSTDNWWVGKNPTETQQAKWLKDVYTELLKNPQVEKIFWAFFRDAKEHWYNGVDYFGMLRWDFSRKPSPPVKRLYAFSIRFQLSFLSIAKYRPQSVAMRAPGNSLRRSSMSWIILSPD